MPPPLILPISWPQSLPVPPSGDFETIAWTSIISCPVSHRIWSSSWTPMSMKMPPLLCRNCEGGGASSHW